MVKRLNRSAIPVTVISLALILALSGCATTDGHERDGEKRPGTAETGAAGLPEFVRELRIPSGIDDGYIMAVKENQAAGQVRPILRLAPFEITAAFDEAIKGRGIDVGEMLKGKLAGTGRFTLLGGEQDLESVMEEQKRALSGLFSGEIELGNLQLAAYTLSGKLTQTNPAVTQMGGHFELKVQVGFALSMVSNDTGEIVHTRNIVADAVEELFVSAEGMIIRGPRNLTDKPLNALKSTGSDIDLVPQYLNALNAAMDETVFFLQEQYPAIGEIVQMDGGRIVTTLGQASGVSSGDYLIIIRLGDPLTNSAGKILGYDKKAVGACRVVRVEKNLTHAEMVPLPDRGSTAEKFDFVVTIPARPPR